ncbi:hypothetical protein SBOR_8944 [Sclerotinia borealis F-4128]|uniref:Uncharacterized protein n=1 Tax=Sclerotinia borealis (strain F-4128) TaxID=1432307 RepID=W9C6Y7_SCLBF|nr:hypothetical protein SBOR_8944 [Sclerotinia borealis F-4128]
MDIPDHSLSYVDFFIFERAINIIKNSWCTHSAPNDSPSNSLALTKITKIIKSAVKEFNKSRYSNESEAWRFQRMIETVWQHTERRQFPFTRHLFDTTLIRANTSTPGPDFSKSITPIPIEPQGFHTYAMDILNAAKAHKADWDKRLALFEPYPASWDEARSKRDHSKVLHSSGSTKTRSSRPEAYSSNREELALDQPQSISLGKDFKKKPITGGRNSPQPVSNLFGMDPMSKTTTKSSKLSTSKEFYATPQKQGSVIKSPGVSSMCINNSKKNGNVTKAPRGSVDNTKPITSLNSPLSQQKRKISEERAYGGSITQDVKRPRASYSSDSKTSSRAENGNNVFLGMTEGMKMNGGGANKNRDRAKEMNGNRGRGGETDINRVKTPVRKKGASRQRKDYLSTEMYSAKQKKREAEHMDKLIEAANKRRSKDTQSNVPPAVSSRPWVADEARQMRRIKQTQELRNMDVGLF